MSVKYIIMSVELIICVWFINVWDSNNLCLIFKKTCNNKNFATLVKLVWWNCIREAVILRICLYVPQVFGEDGVRLMCWAHVFHNIQPKLAAIWKANAALCASMLADIESIQWMAQSEAEFELVCEKFKSHYLEQDLGEVERKLVTDFVEYFLSQCTICSS